VKPRLERLHTHATSAAAAGYDIRYPPVGPSRCAIPAPSANPGANTGSPAAPSSRYAPSVAAAIRGPSNNPSSNTANGCSVSGTGVNHKGSEMCEQIATSALPPTITPAVRSPFETAEFVLSEASGLEIRFSTLSLIFQILSRILHARPQYLCRFPPESAELSCDAGGYDALHPLPPAAAPQQKPEARSVASAFTAEAQNTRPAVHNPPRTRASSCGRFF
jgi:hypothetical protein